MWLTTLYSPYHSDESEGHASEGRKEEQSRIRPQMSDGPAAHLSLPWRSTEVSRMKLKSHVLIISDVKQEKDVVAFFIVLFCFVRGLHMVKQQ